MDGNGRWAQRQGLPRSRGHIEGAEAVTRTVEAAPCHGVTTLSLYAFSSDNWQRPTDEVEQLMRLFRDYLVSETGRCLRNGVRLNIIGRRDRLVPGLLRAVEAAEAATSTCGTLHLRVAIDYSSRDAIIRAATRVNAHSELSRETLSQSLAELHHTGTEAPDVDLLIRTGGDQRLSDFLLWESAYAELYFTDRMWPEFREDDLRAAVENFKARERRFGALPVRAAS